MSDQPCTRHSHTTPVCAACCYTDNSPWCPCSCHQWVDHVHDASGMDEFAPDTSHNPGGNP